MGIAVILPCLGQAHFLKDSIGSVRAQTRPVDEIIVAAGDDDAETRGRELGATVVRVGRGLSVARNEGILASRADLILPLDADDMIAPTFVERTVAAIEGHDIAGTWLQEFGDRHGTWDPGGLERIREENGLCCASLFRREFWERVGGYDPAAIGNEDWDFWVSSSAAGARATVIHERLFHYRIHRASMTAESGHLTKLWAAMIRLRHPALYDPARLAQDRLAVAQMPRWVAEEVRARLARFPENRGLREAAELASGGTASVAVG